MSFPEPYAGLVIRYAYLWRREFQAGRTEAAKDRPCSVILVVTDQDGDQEYWCFPSRTLRRLIRPMQLKFRPT